MVSRRQNLDQQRFLRWQKISEKLWAAENYGKILWVAELGRRKITEKQISGGRFQAADILGCRILDGRPGSIKKRRKKSEIWAADQAAEKKRRKISEFFKKCFWGAWYHTSFSKKNSAKTAIFSGKIPWLIFEKFSKNALGGGKVPRMTLTNDSFVVKIFV